MADAGISAANYAEVGARLLDSGLRPDAIFESLRLLALAVMPFDRESAEAAITLREPTRSRGLSLGDRACLALTLAEGAIAITADRTWKDLNLGCEVELIR